MDVRSQIYYQAGVNLLSARLYDQSIACFYYSVLQKMMYSLTVSKRNPIPYENQNPLDENIHKRMLSDIVQRINTSDSGVFQSLFLNDLLPKRKTADYEQTDITMDACVEYRALCDRMLSILKRYFNPNAK